MDKVIEIAKEVGEEIRQLPEFIEYLKLKESIENNKEISDLKTKIVTLQKSGEREEADKLLSRLNSMPIICNFKSVQEELASTLKTISDILK